MANNKIFFNPFTDFGFKKLFGIEANKDLLIDFLNQILPDKHQVSDLAIITPEVHPDSRKERKAFFDIHCKSSIGQRFIVEMQKGNLQFFQDRALYYTTFPIRDQAMKGDWNFKLDPVYFISLLDFNFNPTEGRNKNLKIDVMLKDQDGKPFYDKLHFSYIQMFLFHKKEADLETHFDKWLFFLKNLENFEDIPDILKEPIFIKGFETARLGNLNPIERKEYNRSLKNYLDMMNVIETEKQISRKEGKKEGKKEQAIYMAMALIADNIAVEKISKYTGLSLQEVEELIKKKEKGQQA